MSPRVVPTTAAVLPPPPDPPEPATWPTTEALGEGLVRALGNGLDGVGVRVMPGLTLWVGEIVAVGVGVAVWCRCRSLPEPPPELAARAVCRTAGVGAAAGAAAARRHGDREAALDGTSLPAQSRTMDDERVRAVGQLGELQAEMRRR